jgi:hypothetical protein
MSSTTDSRTVFVLGKEVDGNREVHVLESGSSYDWDPDTISTYTAGEASFPYFEE